MSGRLAWGSRTSALDETELRAARLEAARRNSRWTEIEETELVRRGPWLVRAETDELFSYYLGAAWVTGSASPVADMAPLYFYADRDGEIVLLERSKSPSMWSEVYARRARRDAAQRRRAT